MELSQSLIEGIGKGFVFGSLLSILILIYFIIQKDIEKIICTSIMLVLLISITFCFVRINKLNKIISNYENMVSKEKDILINTVFRVTNGDTITIKNDTIYKPIQK